MLNALAKGERCGNELSNPDLKQNIHKKSKAFLSEMTVNEASWEDEKYNLPIKPSFFSVSTLLMTLKFFLNFLNLIHHLLFHFFVLKKKFPRVILCSSN